MDTQVLVVGAGPVGLMLAAELRLGGAEVIVVERLAAPTTESRASSLHAPTMEIFDQRGLLERFGTPPDEPMGHFGGVPLPLGQLTTQHPGIWKVPQTRVESVLQDRAVALGAQVRRRHELSGLTREPYGVQAHLAGPTGQVRLRAQFVVGCDGQDSAVRGLGGFELRGTPPTRQLLRADVRGIEVRNRRFERCANGLAIAARRPDGVTRIMVHEAGRSAAGPPDFADVVRAWHRVTGEDIGHGQPVWVNGFGDGNRQVTGYRSGRVLLAGDAAHEQMPIGGQALNLGLADAVNLGWKLAAQVRGTAPPGLLDTYHVERHPAGSRTLGNIAAQAMMLLGGREVDDFRTVFGELSVIGPVRDHLAGMVSGLAGRYPAAVADAHPLVGTALSGADLTGGAPGLLRDGRGLLLDLVDGAPRAAPAGRLAGLDTVLLRPDGYLAWVGTAGLATARRRWFGTVDVPSTTLSPSRTGARNG